MARIAISTLRRYMEASAHARTTAAKGKALEDMITYVFGKVPGVALRARDALNVFESEELDLAFWNTQRSDGFYFLPHILLVECKNWSNPVGAQEVGWFDNKLQRRSRTHGVLIAANGITGRRVDASAAHDILRNALANGRHVVVATMAEITQLRTTDQLAMLLQRKLCELVVSGSVILP